MIRQTAVATAAGEASRQAGRGLGSCPRFLTEACRGWQYYC
jgi:hypothetical protein